MKLDIDLAEKPEVCGPCELTQPSPQKYYPSFHYTGDKPLDIPHEGEMVIRYRKVNSSMSEDERRGTRYSCTVEIQKLISVEGEEVEAPSKKHSEAEDALDKLASEYKKKD